MSLSRERRGLKPDCPLWSQAIDRTANPQRAPIEDVQVDHCRSDVAMPEQFLHGPDVVAVFQQMRRERVTQRILTLPMNRPPPSFTTVTIFHGEHVEIVRRLRRYTAIAWSSSSRMTCRWPFRPGCWILWPVSNSPTKVDHACQWPRCMSFAGCSTVSRSWSRCR